MKKSVTRFVHMPGLLIVMMLVLASYSHAEAVAPSSPDISTIGDREFLCVLEDNSEDPNIMQIVTESETISAPLTGSMDFKLSGGHVLLEDVALTGASVNVAGQSTGELSFSLRSKKSCTAPLQTFGKMILPFTLGTTLSSFYSVTPFNSKASLKGRLSPDGRTLHATVKSGFLPPTTPVVGKARLKLIFSCQHSKAKEIVKHAIPFLIFNLAIFIDRTWPASLNSLEGYFAGIQVDV